MICLWKTKNRSETQITVISKHADLEGDGGEQGEDETQDFKTKTFLENIFVNRQERKI